MDDFERAVVVLAFVLQTILPAVTVVGCLLWNSVRNKAHWFNDIITDEDIEEERANDAPQDKSDTYQPPEEITPLLEAQAPRMKRGLKSWVYVVIGAYELALQIVGLIGVIRSGRPLVAQIVSTAVWVHGLSSPLVWPTPRPPYDLFALYLLALASFLLQAFAFAAHGPMTLPPVTGWMLLHVAACLAGLVLCLDTPVSPPADAWAQETALDTTMALDEYTTLGQWLTALGGAISSIQPILIRRILAALEEKTPNFNFSPWTLMPQYAGFSRLGLTFTALEAAGRDERTAYLFTGLVFASLIVQAHLNVVYRMLNRRFSVRARAEVVGTIFAKALVRIDTSGIVAVKDADQAADMGKLVSLIGFDASQIVQFPMMLDTLFQTPINILILGWFLYDILGVSAFIGYGMFFVVAPFTTWLMTRLMVQWRKSSALRDVRTRAVNELLQSIKFVKFSAWETRWVARILKLRDDELASLFIARILGEIFSLVWSIVPILIACINLTCFTAVFGHQLTVSIAFPAIIALGQLTNELNNVPTMLGQYANLVVAYQRIDDFLVEEEVPAWTSALKRAEQEREDPFDDRLGALKANFRWHKVPTNINSGQPTSAKWHQRFISVCKRVLLRRKEATAQQQDDHNEEHLFELRNIDILFPRGKLSIVTGVTGSGKSSLLSALLGEMECTAGQVLLPKAGCHTDSETGLIDSVSYCAQHPWLESKTIRENVLFGSPFEEERYNSVLEACALNVDLAQLDGGDATEIGDKGIILSGGQKARVALARAVYAHTKTVLLDDVLSAVDTHTAKTLINRCLFGPIMRGRTVVLVTHHLLAVKAGAACIVEIENGTIKRIVDQDQLDQFVAEDGEATMNMIDGKVTIAAEDNDSKQISEKKGKLVEEEEKLSGRVPGTVYLAYLRAASYWMLVIFAFSLSTREAGLLAQKLWIKSWTESYDQPDDWRNFLGFPSASADPIDYVLIYVGLQLAGVFLIVSVTIPSVWAALRASRIMFADMLESVIRSPTRFFDKTPAGRILNRFSKDTRELDGGVASRLRLVGGLIISSVVSIATVTFFIPSFVLALVPLVWLHLYVARGFITASRDLKRLQATAYSPVVTLLERSYMGSQQFALSMENYASLKRCTSFWIAITGQATVTPQVPHGSSTVSTCLTIRLGVSVGLAGIVLTQARSVLSQLEWGLRWYVLLENQMNAVERMKEYIDLRPEPPRHIPGVPAGWPFFGQGITFQDVVLRYAPELEPVLRGVSFHVKPGERIGVVGRTGSGKSTLAQSLFRFVDPDEGSISVAGMDITKLGVEELRSHLTLIPQDAALYSGTIRDNIDPFQEHTDAECLDALKMVQLTLETESGLVTPTSVDAPGTSTAVGSGSATPTQKVVTLESKVSDGGANWSAGQRQLIAMAVTRVSRLTELAHLFISHNHSLLRNSSIIVLDESTASVDFETDKKIQNAIRKQFKGRILLTIAHRLHTVIDYDRILVLDHGQVVEFDSPSALLSKQGGIFRDMCMQSGHFDELSATANEKR
ncbi:P-loop containing nucleoside triphosphate hydrolase protein [Auriculariales sp. MPI-PUGE-AT-0066]|nr:P-loop containing nucleoside triphosphate hydrolase protein [Auriculariales sp. MPI-PUGE-AT-0066]